MGNNGMDPTPLGQTNPRGECMDHHEITLGQVTYEISRIYTGERSVTELIAEHFSRYLSENPSFDEQHTSSV